MQKVQQKDRESLTAFLFYPQQPIHRHLQDLGEFTQFIIRYKSGANLNARNAVTLNNDPGDL